MTSFTFSPDLLYDFHKKNLNFLKRNCYGLVIRCSDREDGAFLKLEIVFESNCGKKVERKVLKDYFLYIKKEEVRKGAKKSWENGYKLDKKMVNKILLQTLCIMCQMVH